MVMQEVLPAKVEDHVTDDINPINAIARNYRWVHTIIGIIGNFSFLLGSVFFLWESLKTAGVWLFIIGSAGMLVGSIGSALVDQISQD
ncbi:MAG: YrhK family protein [Actinomycetota bacterium]|nr:YrhK family protein [Actinomycetota bacterium]